MTHGPKKVENHCPKHTSGAPLRFLSNLIGQVRWNFWNIV